MGNQNKCPQFWWILEVRWPFIFGFLKNCLTKKVERKNDFLMSPKIENNLCNIRPGTN
jgi:hypothetical protein